MYLLTCIYSMLLTALRPCGGGQFINQINQNLSVFKVLIDFLLFSAVFNYSYWDCSVNAIYSVFILPFIQGTQDCK